MTPLVFNKCNPGFFVVHHIVLVVDMMNLIFYVGHIERAFLIAVAFHVVVLKGKLPLADIRPGITEKQ